MKSIWRGIEQRLIGKADKVITINESIAAELCARYGIDKPEIIRNVAKTPGKTKLFNLREKFDIPKDKNIILYQGVLRNGQGLAYQLDILRYLDNAVMIFLGKGPIEEELRRKASENGIGDRAIFAGRVPPEVVMNYTMSADAGILLMEDVALNNRLALPQKLFQYLGAGIPQIVSPMPEISQFVIGEDTGIVVSLDDARKAAESIDSLFKNKNRYEEIKNRCKISSERNNWERESLKLVEIYRELEKGG